MRHAVILLLAFAVTTFAQSAKVSSDKAAGQVWQIPFASTDNTISLGVQNNSSVAAKNVSVAFNDLPT